MVVDELVLVLFCELFLMSWDLVLTKKIEMLAPNPKTSV